MIKFNNENLFSYYYNITRFAMENFCIRNKNYIQIQLINQLKKEVKNKLEKLDTSNHIDILTTPEELFYLSGKKDWGFCKQFLQIPIVRKYIPFMHNIWKNELIFDDLEDATKEYTKGNYSSFQDFYTDAIRNRINKIIYKIEKEYLLKNFFKLIDETSKELEKKYKRKKKKCDS